MKLATEVTIPHGTHTLLATDIVDGRIGGAFLATVTLMAGGTAWVITADRNAGEGEAYTRQPDGTWLGWPSERVVALHARV